MCFRYLAALLLTIPLLGCPEQGGSGTESGTSAVTEPGKPPLAPLTEPTRTICDPFKTNSPQASNRGLVGNLLYLHDDQPRYSRVADYLNFGAIAEPTIYLDRLYIPTRPFDRGFFTQAGAQILNDSGTSLYEYFSLRMQSQLQLAASEAPGLYQLALLADDGAVMKITGSDGVEKVLVDDDGNHPTRMSCATAPVYLDHNTKIPMTVEYYQGPRYHISLVAMWRPWPADASLVQDTACGLQGNSYFFDSTKDPVQPKAPYYELLARQWKVLENENYDFPVQATNPCTPAEEPLAISSFTISAIARDRVTLTWLTNIPASSRGESKGIVSGLVSSSTLDSSAVLSHTVTLTDLAPNTLYSVTAHSISPGGQITASDERAFRTPR